MKKCWPTTRLIWPTTSTRPGRSGSRSWSASPNTPTRPRRTPRWPRWVISSRMGAPFPEIARSGSDGVTASDGGARDWTTQGSLVSKKLDEALFGLPVGELSPILEDEYGLHIVRVTEREGRLSDSVPRSPSGDRGEHPPRGDSEAAQGVSGPPEEGYAGLDRLRPAGRRQGRIRHRHGPTSNRIRRRQCGSAAAGLACTVLRAMPTLVVGMLGMRSTCPRKRGHGTPIWKADKALAPKTGQTTSSVERSPGTNCGLPPRGYCPRETEEESRFM